MHMRNAHQFPHTLKDLAKLIRQIIIKKGNTQQEEEKLVESLIERMNNKAMFTMKTRTGESKEHAKDSKTKGMNILELYKRENGEVPILFESIMGTKK